MNLRVALEERIANNIDFDSHATQLESLRGEFGHTIEMLGFDEPLQECNCVMYALDFRMEQPSTIRGHFYASTAYLKSLVEQGHLIESEPIDGSLAVYYGDNRVEHVGVTRAAGRIVSKWSIGYLYEHEPWEVPSSYGKSIRYFRPIDSDHAFDLLEAFYQ